MLVVRLAGATALVAWAVTLMMLLIPPHPASDSPVRGLTGGVSVFMDLRNGGMSDAPKYDFPTSNPLVAIVAAAAVALSLHAAARHAPAGARGVLSLSAGTGAGSIVPWVWQGGVPLLDCVSDLHAAALLVAFSALGAASRYALAPRWWAAVVVVPALLGLIRFGVECPTGLGVVAAGPLLGLMATGVRSPRIA